MPERPLHVSPRPIERRRAVFGFDASATGVPDRCPPVELSIEPGYYAHCMFAIMHSHDDVPSQVTVNLQYSLDDWNVASGSRTWNEVFADDERLVLISGAQQMQGPQKRFATYPNALIFRNEWGGALTPAKRVLIRPNVEEAADVFVVAELVIELYKDY